MQCPIDQTDLVMTERQGVEIDYCPKCRGVWLDRGELDKIIDRSATDTAPGESQSPASRPAEWNTPSVGGMHGKVRTLDSRNVRDDDRRVEDYDDDRFDDDRRYGGQKKKKRGSFLEDLFDFD